MDRLGYKRSWVQEEGEIPEKRIDVEPHIWNVGLGEVISDRFKYKDIICRKIRKQSLSEDQLDFLDVLVSPSGDTFGHMMIKNSGINHMTKADPYTPIMPNYVRDLAGRIICIAECYPKQKEPASSGRFPKNAYSMDGIEGEDLLENVFFSSFRVIEPSFDWVNIGGDREVQFTYDSPNLHPYKIRPDTFYTDGWKLPQTEMLFVKTNVDRTVLDEATKKFNGDWGKSIFRDDYEKYYENIGGEEYFEDLFNKGVTLIPTLEGYNCNNIVNESFELEDYHHGKFVNNFHEVVYYEDSDLPTGTIIKVIEPGYITEYETKKAKVVVSNGKNYVSNNKKDPNPLYPNLRLPHQRATHKWGSVYIPTHPKHFENPAIWGWDSKTGFFLQEKGPIWDPLHYYYESVDLIIHHYQGEVMDENYWFYRVPEDMKTRFYPVIPMGGFDIFDLKERKERLSYVVRPFTVCKRYHEDVFSVGIGYHPMPLEFEYEFDSWWAPDLFPKNRINKEIPMNIRDIIVDVIQSNVSSKHYLEVQKNNADWNTEKMMLRGSVRDPERDYPYLARYYKDNINAEFYEKLFYAHFASELGSSVERTDYVNGIRMPADIDKLIPDMTLAYYEFRDFSYDVLQKRQSMYENEYGEYMKSVWNCVENHDLFSQSLMEKEIDLDDIRFSSVAIMQPPTF